ncbi:MAG: deoxyhypusine synthase [Thermoprotei archaeon]|nr:MAG: deoxyhypusine synthase [Thermoprotei archaeon]
MTPGDLLKSPIKDVSLRDFEECSACAVKLLKAYEDMGGFSCRYLYKAFTLLREMYGDKTTVFLAFTANLVATGLRGVIADLIGLGYVDVIVTTGGTIDHDIARSFKNYYKGEFEMDDIELSEKGIHRLGNILVPLEAYGPVIEAFTHELLERLIEAKRTWTPSELIKEVGLRLECPSSILRQAALRDVPIFAPGIVDSAFGTAVMTFNETLRSRGREPLVLDIVSDMKKLADIVFSSEKLGAIILGGGIAKHHTIWWAQFKGGLDYAIYITTAVEWDGSLSGARTREAISWGKIKKAAKHVTVPADATVVFPLLAVALTNIERRGKR